MSFKHLETDQVGLQQAIGRIPTIPFIDPLLHHFQSGAVLSVLQPSECSITVMKETTECSLGNRKTEARDAGFESFP